MSDIVERLRIYATDDHERGCQGRCYDCSCGYDEKRDPLLKDAANEIERLRIALKELRAENEARRPNDALSNGMSPVKAAVWHVFGPVCPDFDPDCLTCKAWAEFAALTAQPAEGEKHE